MSDQDRMDFADYIKTLYGTHRYYHVIIAARTFTARFSMRAIILQDLANAAVQGAGQTAQTAARCGEADMSSRSG